ncbi:MAG: hypothetical protein UW14_C0007G0002 [Candidatus Yanofskybacteria bacterium GW2011_GWA2_44_10]|uniref:Prepilin-type N-terminal cleavage/methylation domain-containing protein n=2 Tax=Candidatus Yanofskyibacteriota TaxID=1752733 RepID=A0A0G1L2H9_9BACT|nr:MAG: hypothetical protein UW14_C0007G0002 [Candidatus Yanofskybacteria bacterium GW2011_GWA2_44_10]KKT90013.1 MAG: hypothetical protein UW90_C0008G0002 [Candidatus Yanofskybacteria bacterium GW2011_GWB1_45_11]
MSELNLTYMTGNKGFTLIETITSIFIFSILVVEIGGLMAQSTNLERRAFSAQKIQENTLAVLETMTREIRVGRISNQDNNCTATLLTIEHPTDGTISYSVSNGVVQKTMAGSTVNLSSSEVNFAKLNFCVQGSGVNDNQQPRVTIVSIVENRVGADILQFNIQTTVVSREYSDEF